MAQSPRAFSVGPPEVAVNVGWSVGVVKVEIDVSSSYNQGAPGSRSANVVITEVGRVDGKGEIISQETVQTDDFMSFHAVLEFKRTPADVVGKAFFIVTVSGAVQIVNEGEPPLMVQPFCGLVTGTYNWGPVYKVANPFIPGGFQYFANWSATTSSPAGTSGISGTDGPLAGGQELQEGLTATYSGSDESIWYQSGNGTWVNTGLPCSQLPAEGSPPQQSTRIEGFGMVVRLHDSKSNMPFNNPRQQSEIGFPIIGLTEDHVPIFSDLSDGAYSFTLQRREFLGMPYEQITPIKNVPYKTAFVYPLGPSTAKYNVMLRTITNEAWSPPTEFYANTLPPDSFEVEKFFNPGTSIPAGEVFILRP